MELGKTKKNYKSLLFEVIPLQISINRTGIIEFETFWKRGNITKAVVNGVLDVSDKIFSGTKKRMADIVGRDLKYFSGKITLKGIMKSNQLTTLKIEESKTVFRNNNKDKNVKSQKAFSNI